MLRKAVKPFQEKGCYPEPNENCNGLAEFEVYSPIRRASGPRRSRLRRGMARKLT
jgi:hypothetical protein